MKTNQTHHLWVKLTGVALLVMMTFSESAQAQTYQSGQFMFTISNGQITLINSYIAISPYFPDKDGSRV